MRDPILGCLIAPFADEPRVEKESPLAERPVREISASEVKSRVTGAEGYGIIR